MENLKNFKQMSTDRPVILPFIRKYFVDMDEKQTRVQESMRPHIQNILLAR